MPTGFRLAAARPLTFIRHDVPSARHRLRWWGMRARDFLAALGAVCGTGFGFLMTALEYPVWTVAVAFLFSVWCTWLIARGTFR